MKTKDVANQYGLDRNLFEIFLKQSNHKIKNGVSGKIIDDSEDVDAIVAEFKRQEDEREAKWASSEEAAAAEINQYKAEREAKRASSEIAATEKKAVLAEMLITSGFNFDGYTITKYSGYISGDDAISVDRGLTIFGVGVDVKDKLLGSLVKIRRNALAELKEAAYALGCNAVIGVDFDYLTLDPQTANLAGGTSYQPYIFGVTANGNAVVIEKK